LPTDSHRNLNESGDVASLCRAIRLLSGCEYYSVN